MDTHTQLSTAYDVSTTQDSPSQLHILLKTEPKASTIYSLLHSTIAVRQKSKIEEAWKRNFLLSWPDHQWNKVWSKIRKSSRAANITQTLFFVYNRLLFTLSVLSKQFTTVPDVCWTCSSPKADLFHMLFACPTVLHFLKQVWSQINLIFDTKFPFSYTHLFLDSQTKTVGRLLR